MQLVFLTGFLFSTCPLLAASNVKLSGVMPAFGDVIFFQISPDGRYAVYLADQDTDGVLELYSVPLGGPAAAGIKLNGALVASGDVGFFRISADSGRVVYIADQDANEVFELYMTSDYFLYLPLLLKQS